MKCEPLVTIPWSPNSPPTGIYRRLFFARRPGLKGNQSLPSLTCEATDVQVESENLNDYRFVTHAPSDSQHVPLFYPHALFGSAHLLMIAHAEFPLRASGLLHLRNHVIQRRPFSADEKWGMRCVLTRQRHVEKGLEFDFDSVVTIDGQVVWESVSTYFKRGKAAGEIESTPLSEFFDPLEATPATAVEFGVPHNIGKRYAKVSGDYNPIHVSNLAAKLFGFKRAIAHGMWSVARTVGELPSLNGAIRHDVAFKGPMFVNSQAEIKSAEDGRFEIYCGTNARPVIVGRYTSVGESEQLVVS